MDRVRRSNVLVATVLVLVACTSRTDAMPSLSGSASRSASESGQSTTSSRSASPTPTASSATGATSPTAPAQGDAAARLTVTSRDGGSFRVHGEYPHVSSSCRDAEQPEFDAHYPGTLLVDRADDGTLSVMVALSFERYLEGIAEVPPSWPVAALEAQAIAARSYALAVTGWSGPEGAALGTPICSTSSCQVYRGIPIERTPGIRRWYAAVRRTSGRVLLSGDRPIEAVYFSTSNGQTYGNDQVFGSDPLPYLRPRIERDDGASPTSTWRVTVPLSDLATFLRAAGLWPEDARVTAADRREGSIVVRGPGTSRTMDVDTFDSALNTWAPCLAPARYPTPSRFGPALPATVPSEWYTVADGRNGVVLRGRGWGHGAGMVQWGAFGKAKRGWSTARILAFYYGGLRAAPFPEPGLIRVQVADGLTSLAIRPTAAGTVVDGRRVGPGALLVRGGERLRVRSAPLSQNASIAATSATRSEGDVVRIGNELRARLTGRNWHPGCPVALDDLRLVRVRYRTFDGNTRVGPLVVNERVADDVAWVFRRLFRARFPIHRIGLPPKYRPPLPKDWNNRRNLTSAFNCRPATGNPGSLSHHSYGWAIDVNPLRNPYIGPDGNVLRRAAKRFVDRTRRVPGMIHEGDVVVRSFAAIGWEWGGDWSTLKDYMHFSLTGR